VVVVSENKIYFTASSISGELRIEKDLETLFVMILKMTIVSVLFF
jgi:hypothetical protein